mgnify:CR=1 FL=1
MSSTAFAKIVLDPDMANCYRLDMDNTKRLGAPFFAFGLGRCARCSRITILFSGRTVTGVERDMCVSCWAPDSCRIVDHPGEMGPFYCEHCAASGPDDHEDGCERYCRTHMVELGDDGCSACRLDDAADEAGIGRRSRVRMWAPGACS